MSGGPTSNKNATDGQTDMRAGQAHDLFSPRGSMRNFRTEVLEE